ncbi:MAG: TonB-dependent receptor, partial [Planctomycetes bacterium]|nr:TonB-dependent receptor [Planctomycetota bacterium]
AMVKPANQRNQYGFTAGFPVLKDRLFAYGSFDRTRYQGTQGWARDLVLPSELALPRLTRGNDTPENRAWIQSILDRYPKDATPNDSRSPRTYSTNVGFRWPDEDHSGRLDWQLGQDSIVGRYQYTHQIRETDDVILGENAKQNNTQQNLGITWTKVFRNNMVGEFRYGLGLRKTLVDIAAGNDTPIVRFTLAGGDYASTILGNAGNYPIHRDQTDHQFVYNLSWMFASSHTLKAGTDIRRQALDDLADNYSRGYWTFNRVCGGVTYATPYHAFLDGCVRSFVKAWGPFFLENRMNEANFYVEDQWRPLQSLTVSAGLRYEYVSAPKEVENHVDYVYKNDKNNYEPRLGGAWALPASSGFLKYLTGTAPGTASVRGGYARKDGRIFQSVFSQGGANVRYNPPNALYQTFSTQSGVTSPGILNVADPTLGFVFTPGPQTARYSITKIDPGLEMPYTNEWSISYERQMPFDSALRVTYTGNHVTGNLRYTYDNLPVSPVNGPVLVVDHPNNAPAAGFPDLRGKTITRIAADVACAGTGYYGIATTTACPVPVPIADNEISLRVPRSNERRPDPRYTTNLVVSSAAEAWYKGLQIEWAKRFSKGFSFTATYTRSNSEDTTSEATYVGTGDTNALGPDKEYAKGFSRMHTPHRFTLYGTWAVPFMRTRQDLVGSLLGGWQLSGTLRLASGTPFTVTQTGLDLNFDGFAEGRPVILDTSILGAHVN